jgi:hypothetical protein
MQTLLSALAFKLFVRSECDVTCCACDVCDCWRRASAVKTRLQHGPLGPLQRHC